MIVRAPIVANVIWLTIVLAPQALVAIQVAAHSNAILFVATLGIASMASQYIYLALIRNTRRRVLQTLVREKALNERKPFVLISRSYDQSKAFLTSVSIPVPGIATAHHGLFESLI